MLIVCVLWPLTFVLSPHLLVVVRCVVPGIILTRHRKPVCKHLQIGNLVHPNSPHNTIVFCAFEASDTSCNLHIGLGHYVEQIACLKDLEWE